LGLVRAWNGDVEGARGALRDAISLGAAQDDHWAVFECSARLLLMEADVGDPGHARPLLPELAHAAARLGTGGSETRFASAIVALHRLMVEPSEMDAFLSEVTALEAIDARFLVPELLGIAAQLALRRADLDKASTLARRALDIAGTVDKPNEAARAHAILACVAAGRKDAGGVMAHIRAARASASMPVHVENLLREAARLADARA
jgi:hypothetical protein